MSATVHINELNPEARARLLAQIPSTEGGTTALATAAEQSSLTLGDPAILSNDQLADIVIEGFKKMQRYLPYIVAMKARFDTGVRDSKNHLKTLIKGCDSWQEFCFRHLDRTPRAIRKAMADAKKPASKPTLSADDKYDMAVAWLQDVFAKNDGKILENHLTAPAGYLASDHRLGTGYTSRPAIGRLRQVALELGVQRRASGERGGIYWHLPATPVNNDAGPAESRPVKATSGKAPQSVLTVTELMGWLKKQGQCTTQMHTGSDSPLTVRIRKDCQSLVTVQSAHSHTAFADLKFRFIDTIMARQLIEYYLRLNKTEPPQPPTDSTPDETPDPATKPPASGADHSDNGVTFDNVLAEKPEPATPKAAESEFALTSPTPFESLPLCAFKPDLLTPDEAPQCLAVLSKLPWGRHVIEMYGKQTPAPRLVAWMGVPPQSESYTGKTITTGGTPITPIDWTPAALAIKQRVEEFTHQIFDSLNINFYRDHNDHVGWHSDDEDEGRWDFPIASVSLGGVRKFQIRQGKDGRIYSQSLPSGSLVVMPAGFQRDWLHRLAPTRKPCGPRINLTFRRIIA